MARAIVAATLTAVASWAVLLLVLGNVGLQQTISLGPLRPDGVIVAYGAMGLVAAIGGWIGTSGATLRSGTPGIVALLVIDLVAAIAATFVIGELELVDVPAVLVVITGVGLQPVGFFVGSAVAGLRAAAT